MSIRWNSIELKVAGLLTALLVILVYAAFTFRQSQIDIDRNARQLQDASYRTTVLSQFLAAVTEAEPNTTASNPESGGTLRAQLLAFERIGVALESLRTSYQYDGAVYARLARYLDGVTDDIASLRRSGEQVSSTGAGGFDQSGAVRLATELLAVEQNRSRDAGIQLAAAIEGITRTWLIAFGAVLVGGLGFVFVILRQIKAWRARAAHPSAEVFLRPGEEIIDRNAFVTGITSSIAASLNRSRTVGVLAIGVNNLASLRETEGQEAVDELMAQLSNRLRTIFRRSDLVTRLNGDVIMAMLHDIKARSDLAECDKRIHRAVDGLLVPGIQGGHLSVKVGSAMYPIDGYSGDELISAACDDLRNPTMLNAPPNPSTPANNSPPLPA